MQLNELILGRIALWCGLLMLFGIMSDRTTWVKLSGRGQSMTDGAVYNSVASLSGIVALMALAVGLNTRPRLAVALTSLLVAIAAFGLSVFVSGLGVWARTQGEIWVYSGGTFAGDIGPKWVADPADGPYLFTFLASLGVLAVIGLGITWLWDARRSRHAPQVSALRVAGGRD